MAASGVWVAFDQENLSETVIESAAESALWAAVARGQKVVFWPFGKTIAEAISDGVTKAKPTTRTAAKAAS